MNDLIKATRREPFRGLGKPEDLRGDMSGWWSRRITNEQCIVCRIVGKGDGQQLEIAQLRFRY